MKIFVDGLIYTKQKFGGINKVWEELLKRLIKFDIEIDLYAPKYLKKTDFFYEIMGSKKVNFITDNYIYPRRIFSTNKIRSSILKFFLDTNVSIFHSTYYSTVNLTGIKNVVTIHDMIPEIIINNNSPSWAKNVILQKKYALNKADKIVAVSHNTKNDLLKFYPDIKSDKIEVVYNGISKETDNGTTSLNNINAKFKLNLKQKNYFLHIGNIGMYKNFKLIYFLIKKFKDLSNFQFINVGARDLKYNKKDFDLPNIKFIERADRSELSILYSNATALIFPSLYEGFGIPIIEAMKNNCPVLCSNCSCFPEIAGDAALYFDPYNVDSLKNSIDMLLKKDFEINSLLSKGKENINRFNWDNSTQRLYKIYESLL